MFEENSKLNKSLLIVASVAFLINIFISILNYANYSNGMSIAIIIVSVIALLIIFGVWSRSRRHKKDEK